MHHVVTAVAQTPSSLILNYLHALLQDTFLMSGIVLPLVLILLDVLTGILASLKKHVFAWDHIADFLSHDLVKYLSSSVMVVSLYLLYGKTSPLTVAALALPGLLAVSVAASIYQNVLLLFPRDVQLTAFVGEELQKVVPQFQPAQYAQPQQVQMQYTPPAQPQQYAQVPYARPQFMPQSSGTPSSNPYMDPSIINVTTSPMSAMPPSGYPQLQPTVNGQTGNQVLPGPFTPAAVQTPQGPQYAVSPLLVPLPKQQ